jgi:nitrite reductase/ring-hydroxylating ferredoxin subunit
MTATYKLVQWNRHKKVYDVILGLGVGTYLGVFICAGLLTHRAPNEISLPILAMRALATLAIILLHVILAIGPLARLTDRMAPLLYNRRHLGVTFFLVAATHAALALGFYGGFGVRDPFSALVAGYDSYGSISGFPFEVLGFLALLIFFVMASTSHDFWLANLGARTWKALHMLVYVAYGLVVMHVALGALQAERNPSYVVLLFGGVIVIAALHVAAGMREFRRDERGVPADAAWVDVASVDEIEDNAAKVVCFKGRERVAVFRYDGKVSAVSNVCAHQGGPLGEGRVVDGCITCPWHGYQYLPGKGQSPPPYTETIPTYEVRLDGRRIMLNPSAKRAGTPVAPAIIEGEAAS